MCEFSFLSKPYAFHIFLFPVFLPLSVDMDNNSDPNLTAWLLSYFEIPFTKQADLWLLKIQPFSTSQDKDSQILS